MTSTANSLNPAVDGIHVGQSANSAHVFSAGNPQPPSSDETVGIANSAMNVPGPHTLFGAGDRQITHSMVPENVRFRL